MVEVRFFIAFRLVIYLVYEGKPFGVIGDWPTRTFSIKLSKCGTPLCSIYAIYCWIAVYMTTDFYDK